VASNLLIHFKSHCSLVLKYFQVVKNASQNSASIMTFFKKFLKKLAAKFVYFALVVLA
jgi:hypothetical protein